MDRSLTQEEQSKQTSRDPSSGLDITARQERQPADDEIRQRRNQRQPQPDSQYGYMRKQKWQPPDQLATDIQIRNRLCAFIDVVEGLAEGQRLVPQAVSLRPTQREWKSGHVRECRAQHQGRTREQAGAHH